ncbi:protein kinase domain-containing protein [Arabiibacter massiliensis]|uniref:protein kinase domain-containing protein n=1 Tax=Arabiibacter massiliensis TaxID=1870985 RepID=UPI00155A4775|nr:protein kinase [Arabiibacter massiliensis]
MTHLPPRGLRDPSQKGFVLVSRSLRSSVFRIAAPAAKRADAAAHCVKVTRGSEKAILRQFDVLKRLSRCEDGCSGALAVPRPLPDLVSFGMGHAESGKGTAFLWIATPWVRGMSLDRHMATAACEKRESLLVDALELALALAEAINGLSLMTERGRKLVHGDIKPSNIIVSTGGTKRISLVDFDTLFFQGDEGAPPCGTYGYSAPEIVAAEEEGWACGGDSADVYSFGVVAHEMLTGAWPYPFPAGLIAGRSHWISWFRRSSIIRIEERLPPDVHALLLACLARDPCSRPRCDEVVAILKRMANRYRDSSILCSRRTCEPAPPTPASSAESAACLEPWIDPEVLRNSLRASLRIL